jgi:hypothetical protein
LQCCSEEVLGQIWSCFKGLSSKFLGLFLEVIQERISKFLWTVIELFFLLLGAALLLNIYKVSEGMSRLSFFYSSL